jgi:endonuclease/exonuclease/phosphatase family metal-dependent hydrolase
MRRIWATTFFTAFIIVIILLAFFSYEYVVFYNQKCSALLNETFTVASWNLQIFGDKKGADSSSMNTYASIISKYDIIFIEEIRDSDNSSFKKLCNMLPLHECFISSRAGRSSSKEQYGVIYLKSLVQSASFLDYNPDALDRWERPLLLSSFKLRNYSVNIIVMHTRPDNVASEMSSLEDAARIINGNVIILGDLNADCSYYSLPVRDFESWHWIIGDGEDTTATHSDCAYDRIILNDDAYDEFLEYGVYKNTSAELSDHYLVWLRMRIKEYSRDKGFKAFLDWQINEFH